MNIKRSPIFSIIVPVYNVAPYLKECLDSVLNQTFTDWECICVDDGSTDESGMILDQYAHRDARFIVKHQKNMGVSVARNYALTYCRGEYVTFLDADDVVAPDWLQVYLKTFEETNVDLVRICMTEFDDFPKLKYHEQDFKRTLYTRQKNLLRWGWPTFSEYGWVWAYSVRRILLNGINFPVGMRFKEDCVFSFSVLNRITSLCQLQYFGYFYRQRNSSAVSKKRSSDDCWRVIEEFNKLILAQRGTKQDLIYIRKILSWSCWTDICGWLKSPADLMNKELIRENFKCLCGPLSASSILKTKKHWFPALVAYRKWGWIWPIRITQCLIRSLVSFKKVL